jgi:hypothetical protein
MISELEFSITQLGVNVEEWLDALQYIMSGKVTINLISPKLLEEIITSVTLGLSEGYELAAGSHPDGLAWYYEALQTLLLTDAHELLIVILITLKDINRHFQLFKVYNFPTHLFNATYGSFQVENEYMVINIVQRSYFTMTSIERKACQGKSLLITPANKPVFSMNVQSCLLSLFLQARDVNQRCRRSLYTAKPTPFLERYGEATVYFFVEPTRVTSRCLQDRTWVSSTVVLHVAGSLSNTEPCHFSTESLQL